MRRFPSLGENPVEEWRTMVTSLTSNGVGSSDERSKGRTPRVSIGLPVYNGEEYLEEAIDSILAQTFEDFELIISDNASTDLTEKICRRFAAEDTRIIYSRNAENIGGMNNANLTFSRARGEYFRFAGHDDRYAPELLERLVTEFDQRPDAIICYSATVQIDGQGNETGVRYPIEGTAATPVERFRELVLSPWPGGAIYGLIRSDVLRRTKVLRSYTGSDYNLLCELAMRGPFHFVPERLFFNRFHEGNVYKDSRGRMAWARPDLANSGRPTFPYWLRLAHYVEILTHAPLSVRERASCAALLLRWVRVRWRSLGWDLGLAAMMLTHSKKWRVGRYSPERWWY
jgi:glycosyltransferase involved in cell wall biosynthesis